MSAWVQTKYLFYRDVPEAGEILFVVPYEGFTLAYVHKRGTFHPFREQTFYGPDAVAEAKRYLEKSEVSA
jgi:hypothetical protein